MSLFDDILFEVGLAARAVGDAVTRRSLRLGVTGLSRSGKTVFITALVNTLLNGAKLPVFQAAAEGRIARVHLEPQPDDDVPRFPYEEQWQRLTGADRTWPLSTRTISQLRLVFEYESTRSFVGGASTFTLDIVDYPGEWLLDLSLLNKTYAEWSAEAMTFAEQPQRSAIAREWLATAKTLEAAGPAHEDDARRAAEVFTRYLRSARDQTFALSTLPPGRFLMPGDLEGSPALTFAPLWLGDSETPAAGSLAAMMARRYDAYRNVVVRPFFARHFARLDRQIVLIDALAALNSGPAALRDLEYAMTQVLLAFRTGRHTLLGSIFRPRVDRILIAATKADHLHHASHDRLEDIVRLLAARAIARATGLGASIDVVALAAVRATREAEIRRDGEVFQAIVGVPEKGESLDGQIFDGVGEVATFPGQLPEAPALALSGDGLALSEEASDFRFLKFRPPIVAAGASAPFIRLDRAMQFLLGDRLA
jgi:predicted YcjX-like family ATPase